jgi:hypothetical protein
VFLEFPLFPAQCSYGVVVVVVVVVVIAFMYSFLCFSTYRTYSSIPVYSVLQDQLYEATSTKEAKGNLEIEELLSHNYLQI